MVLIIGVSGACRKHELVQLTVDDIEDLNSAVLIKISDTKTKAPRSFTVTGKFYKLFKKYASLRPPNTNERRFFLNYQNTRCTRQPVGINKIGGIPKQVAQYLGLKDPTLYTGHCYRRSSATILVDAGGDITTLKRHGGWKSTAIAESYIDDSISGKMKIADTFASSVNQPSTCTKDTVQATDSLLESHIALSNTVENSVNDSFSLQASKHSKKFFNCYNNNITINVVNEMKK